MAVKAVALVLLLIRSDQDGMLRIYTYSQLVRVDAILSSLSGNCKASGMRSSSSKVRTSVSNRQ